MVFAMSSPRFGVAPAAGAAGTAGSAQLQKRAAGKKGTARTKAATDGTRKSADKGATIKSGGGDVEPATVCAQNQPINFGQTVSGTLANGDCLNPVEGDGSLVDEYTFNGTVGQQITITMNSTAFDTVLYLLSPSGTELAFNDDIDRSTNPPNRNSRIVFTLQQSGVFSILANSFAPEGRGAYTLSLTTSGTCTTVPINFNETKISTLSTGDCANDIEGDATFVEYYTFSGTAGQQIAITMTATSGNLDPYLYLLTPGVDLLADDNNGGGGTTARIPQGVGTFGRLPVTGTYTIVANTFAEGQSGNYSLTLSKATTDCAAVPFTLGATVNGSLANGDCRLLEDGSLLDAYTFSGTAGRQIVVTMTSANTAALVPVVFLLSPTGATLAIDVNNAGGATARIPGGSGSFTLPATGTYTVLANSFSPNQAGNYSLRILDPAAAACTTTLAATGREVSGGGGQFSFGFTTQPGCPATATSNSPFITDVAASVDGNGNGTVTYTVQANSATGRSGTITINGQTFTITQAAICTTTLAATGREVSGDGGQFSFSFTTQPGCPATVTNISAPFITNVAASVDGNGNGTVTYTVQANSSPTGRSGTITINGQTFTVTQGAATSCIYAVFPTVRPFTEAGGTNGRFTVITQNGCAWSATTNTPWITITEGAGTTTGTGRVRYTVAANSTSATRTGTISAGGVTHTVTQTSAGTTPQIQFSGNGEFIVNENDASRAATITVTRTGDTTGAATIEYATIDDQSEVPCDPTIRRGDGSLFPQGTAYARCDYATTIDTLTFNAGETTKTLAIPLINDLFQEGNETFRIALSNPQGATLGTGTTAIVTIQSDDTAPPTSNPINQIPFFVRQQYLDFLDREPEAGEPWTGVLNRCGNIFTGPEVNRDCDRIAVSGAFFGSPEFRIKGFFVFLHYKAVFGSANNPLYVPQYVEFVSDARRVSGLTAEEVIAKRLDFSEDFLARTSVANAFSGTSNEAFVDRLLSNLGITLTTADQASGQTRNSLVASLNNGTRTRAQVLRIIVESTEAIAAQFNRAFVAIQYYGYLRRTPEARGYEDNLNALNQTNNSRQLINGFLNSIEYRLRFGANSTN